MFGAGAAGACASSVSGAGSGADLAIASDAKPDSVTTEVLSDVSDGDSSPEAVATTGVDSIVDDEAHSR